MTAPAQPVHRSGWSRLYHGETEIEFIARWKIWFAISAVIILIGLASLFTRGLNLGIDFEGGNVWQVPQGQASLGEVEDALDELGLSDAEVQTLTPASGDAQFRVQAEAFSGSDAANSAKNADVVDRLASLTGEEVDVDTVGPSWGRQISSKALRALLVFLVAIGIYITLRFEFRMAVATLAALLHDILIVVGVYSITGLPVTPATVIAILTILGFSIYDGIVVFDRVDENTKLLRSGGRLTYSGMTNLSLNQVLMRSLNTSITAMIPILSLLLIGALWLGAATLLEFALALLIGVLSGAYSSIFIASPLLALLKEREPRYAALRRRLDEQGMRAAPATRAEAEAALEGDEAVGAPTPVGSGLIRSRLRPSGRAAGATTTRTRSAPLPRSSSAPLPPAPTEPVAPSPVPARGASSSRKGGATGAGSRPPAPSGAKRPGPATPIPPRPRKKTKKR